MGDGIFFRINTKSHFAGSLLLKKRDHPFLKWDSYLECGGPVEFDRSEIDDCINKSGGFAGHLSDDVMKRLAYHVETLKQLTIAEKRRFVASINQECTRRGI